MRVKISNQDLVNQFNDQYKLLKQACNRYDEGNFVDAKNIALKIRVFVHNSKNSKSVLKQLACSFQKSLKIKTDKKIPEPNTVLFLGLRIRIDSKKVEFIPKFDLKKEEIREVSYKQWWNKTLLIVNNKKFSRKDIILTLSDQQGGAHVDSSLDEDYHHLTKGDLLTTGVKIQSNANIQLPIPVHTIPYIVARESGFWLIESIEKNFGNYLSS